MKPLAIDNNRLESLYRDSNIEVCLFLLFREFFADIDIRDISRTNITPSPTVFFDIAPSTNAAQPADQVLQAVI
jgi:hypothetical protein